VKSAKQSLLPPPATDEEIALMRAVVHDGAADRPGIYRMLADDGEVVYVGKSKRVRTRLLSYFRCSYPGDKGARILRQARKIDWEYTPSEFAALLQELRLIKTLRPRFNVAMKRDARHFAFIKLTTGIAPRLLVVRGASDDSAVYYGPFQGAQRIGDALRELNDVLGLRDCSLDKRMHFADQQDLFPILARTPGCIRYEIRKCLGPCIGACSEAEYTSRVALARQFLDGSSNGPLETLRAEMEQCSQKLEFERAGYLRDKLHRLEELREQFIRFRYAVETLSFVYTVKGYDGDDRAYVIRKGRVRGEHPAPRTKVERRSLHRLAEEIFGSRERESATVPTHEIDELLLLSSWFRRFPKEMEKTERAVT
jgi:excinuclease ABC subunit C